MAGQFSLADAKGSRWPVLIAVDGDSGPAGVALNRPVCVVGSPGRAHLPLKAKQVSKTHALIVQEADGVYVRDLCSTNKTFINGDRIREVSLKDKQILRFGTCAYHCHSGFTRIAKSQSAPPAELHFTPGDSASRQIRPLDQRTFLIGRRDGCDLVIRGKRIAAAHVVVFSQNGKWFLLDLASQTEIAVNGTPVREVELQTGDVIQIGEFRVEYYLREPAISSETSDSLEQISIATEDLAVDEAPAAQDEQIPQEEQVSQELPAAAKPAAPPIDLSGLEYPTGEQEPAYLRGEPLFLKCETPFPAFVERSEDQLELRIEGDILTGALKRSAAKVLPRTNKRPPVVTNEEQLLSNSFVLRR